MTFDAINDIIIAVIGSIIFSIINFAFKLLSKLISSFSFKRIPIKFLSRFKFSDAELWALNNLFAESKVIHNDNILYPDEVYIKKIGSIKCNFQNKGIAKLLYKNILTMDRGETVAFTKESAKHFKFKATDIQHLK